MTRPRVVHGIHVADLTRIRGRSVQYGWLSRAVWRIQDNLLFARAGPTVTPRTLERIGVQSAGAWLAALVVAHARRGLVGSYVAAS